MRSIQKFYDDTREIINFGFLCCLFADSKPMIFNEVVIDKRQRQAMEEEIQSIEKNYNWEFTTLPKDNRAIGVKWVYKMKKNVHGKLEKYKVRRVAKGYKQRHGIDYEEVYTPVDRMETIRLYPSTEVKSAFLNGYLEEVVYVEKPLVFVVKNH